MADGKIYLDVQNWENYKYRTEKVKFLTKPTKRSTPVAPRFNISPARGPITFIATANISPLGSILSPVGESISTDARANYSGGFKDMKPQFGSNKVRGWLGY